MRTLILVIGALLLVCGASAAATQKSSGSCSVTPSTVAVGQTLTITATANVLFDFDLVDPTGIVHVWPQSQAGEVVSYQFAPDVAGDWLVRVNEFKGRTSANKHVIATCSFTVTAPS